MGMKRIALPVSILRGGTSKGVYIRKDDLPANEKEVDAILLRLMGSPDKKQIDGLGGATSVTSKVGIISPSGRDDAHVDYIFAQVSVDKALVSYKGNCGNISSGVGAFAIEKGMVTPTAPVTCVRIFNTNTGKIMEAEIQTPQGMVDYEGTFAIAGVPGTGAPVKLKFMNPAGTLPNATGLLPTGNPCDALDVPGFGSVTVSLVDATNPLVFVRATDIGFQGTELPVDIDGDPEKLDLLERIRAMAAVKLGLIDDYATSAYDSPGVPKMTVVSCAQDYVSATGVSISASEVDLVSRMMSMQKTHPTYAMTGAMCTAAACVVQGSVVNQVLGAGVDTQCIRIGHPAGILEAGVDYHHTGDELVIDDTFGFRTTRLLLDGTAYVSLAPGDE